MTRAAKLGLSSTIVRAGREAVAEPRNIAINLAPLLTPYKKHGRLTLRIERLPQKSRLSRGSRNNDGSWSLATDELEDLTFQLPEGSNGDHALVVRIISTVHGNTLAVLDFRLAREDAAPAQADGAANGAMAEATNDTQLQQLREKLAAMKAALAETQSELTQSRQVAERAAARPLSANIETELATARIAWSADLERRLAAAAAEHEALLDDSETRAQCRLADAGKRWQAEEEARLAAVEAQWQDKLTKALAEARAQSQATHDQSAAAERQGLHERIGALEATLAERETAPIQAQEAAELARETSQREAYDALLKAEQAWKVDEAARLAAAEAQWRDTSTKALAEAREDAGLAHDQQRELREKLATLETTLTERGAKLADANAAVEQARSVRQQETRDALLTAERALIADEATRFATAEAQWQAKSAKALAAVRAEAAAARDQNNDGELETVRAELSALQAKLAERDGELASARAEAAALSQNAHGQMTALRAQLSALQAKLTQRDVSLSAARAEAAIARSQHTDGEIRALRAELVALQEKLAERDDALADAQASQGSQGEPDELSERLAALEATLDERDAALAEAREIIEQQTEAAQGRAQRNRKSDDAKWLAAAEAEWRKKHSSSLAEATARYEAAEGALAQVRIRAKDEGRVHQDLATTRVALAAREAELANLRAKIDPSHEHTAPEGDTDAPESTGSDSTTTAPEQPPASYSLAFIGGVIAAACLVAAVVVFSPEIDSLIFGAPHAPVKITAPAPKVAAQLAPVAAPPHMAVVTRNSNLRADSAAAADVVATLPRGSNVEVVEERAKWTLVRADGPKPQQGWIAHSALKEASSLGP